MRFGNKFGAQAVDSIGRTKKVCQNQEIDFTKVWDSKREYEYSLVLQARLEAGEISDLIPHPKFRLDVGGVHICKYTADFQYVENGETFICDVKSKYTVKETSYILRKKMMFAILGIKIREVLDW